MKPKDYIKAMTTGRWPPKPEDDMPISPGTERAIMHISDTIPLLAKSVVELTKSLERLEHSLVLVGRQNDTQLFIGLYPAQWVDVVNATDIRIRELKERTPKTLDASELLQLRQLLESYQKITTILTQNSIASH